MSAEYVVVGVSTAARLLVAWGVGVDEDGVCVEVAGVGRWFMVWRVWCG